MTAKIHTPWWAWVVIVLAYISPFAVGAWVLWLWTR